MTREHGGKATGLAPVIPLFGAVPGSASTGAEAHDAPATESDEPGRGAPVALRVAPPQAEARATAPGREQWHTTWQDDEHVPEIDDSAVEALEAAESVLVKKLRRRSMSVSEARLAMRDLDLDPSEVEHLLARFTANGYLDDFALAEQIVDKATSRHGQGRRVISLKLSQRGIARDVVDAALEALPDDDAERALEYARSKARSMTDLDRDVALRRLAGQLSRRGYGGAALSAARQALDEAATPPQTRSGVRFE